MQKVVYSIRKVNRDERLKGVGYLSEGCLLIPQISQKGKAYIRVFEDVAEKCKLVLGTEDEPEYSGTVTIAYTDVPVYDKEKDNYKYVDYMEVEYHVWYKFMKEE